MPIPQVSLDLMEFIEQNILPKYTEFGTSHGLKHVMRVIANSLELVRITGVDANMAYTVAAYHDIGMSGPRAIHHITGGKILAQDARLKRWFTAEQIKTMREAVEDHRASASHQPRNIYGKIVAEADRDLDQEEIFRRAIDYGLEQYSEKTVEEQWKRFRKHMYEKYSVNGYIRLWLPNSPNEKKLKQLRETIADDKKLRAAFDRLYRQKKEK